MGSADLRAARHRGEEHLLERRLTRRLSTGELLEPCPTRRPTPPADPPHPLALRRARALDHLRAASAVDGTRPDPRAADAVALLRAARRPDGRWSQGPVDPGAVWFAVDAPPGEPSRWLTLSAVRVLRWWDLHHQRASSATDVGG